MGKRAGGCEQSFAFLYSWASQLLKGCIVINLYALIVAGYCNLFYLGYRYDEPRAYFTPNQR